MTIRIVDKLEMQYLNSTYRGKNKPTNVLSFKINTFLKINHQLLGDLVLCKEIIEKESLKYKKTLKSHWAHIVIHGTLHLIGYDHKKYQQAHDMEKIEKKILASLNYLNPYVY